MLNPSFHYQNNQLYCDSVRLDDIADAAGTPVYVYSGQRIQENARRIQTAFPNANLHYSLKANANLSIIRLLADMGLGMDAVSGGEIFRAFKAGVHPAKIVFAGVGKTSDELRYALEVGVGWFNVESRGELLLLNQLAGEMGKTAQVALRLNPAIQAQTHHHIATGHSSAKFGMPADVIHDILVHQDRYRNLHITGIHVHIGSQLADTAETIQAIQQAQALLEPYPALRTLNVGGGLPVNYTADDEYPSIEVFAQALQPHTKSWSLKLEPGRSIVADAGVLLVTVLYLKTQGDHHFNITDGSMTELIRPALYDAVHPIIPLKQSSEPAHETYVTGAVCETADVLNPHAQLPISKPNERLAVLMAGAYGFVMASNYNQRPRPAEVLVEGDTWRFIRQRETWEDLIRLENV